MGLRNDMARSKDFQFYCPVSFFEKAEEPEGRRRRVGGVISSENWDQQDEMVVQRGLSFDNLAWLNDNHQKGMDGIVGVPDRNAIRQFEKGDILPDGEVAGARCTWSEGWILEGDDRADRIWSKAMALQKAGFAKKLGFSIEGKILRRAGVGGKIIAQADVTAVALTHCPVNRDTYLVNLAKAMHEVAADDEGEGEESGEKKDKKYEAEEKAFTVTGGPAGQGVGERKPLGPVTGQGAGRVTTPESLESKAKPQTAQAGKTEMAKARRVLEQRTGMPYITDEMVARFVALTREMKHAKVI